MAALHTIRTTVNPEVQITVDHAEYERLLDMGLIYDGTPPIAPVDPFDGRVAARVADPDSQTRVALAAWGAGLPGGGAATVTANTQTGTAYMAVAADAGKAVEMNNAAANTLTIPANVFTAGQIVEVFQAGAGQTTIVAGSGLTLRAPDGGKLAKQYASASLRFRSATEAVLAGNTVP